MLDIDFFIPGSSILFFLNVLFLSSLTSVKNLWAIQETRVQSLGLEDPLEKEMATHSSILAWRIPWTDHGCRVRHDWMTNTHIHTHTNFTFLFKHLSLFFIAIIKQLHVNFLLSFLGLLIDFFLVMGHIVLLLYTCNNLYWILGIVTVTLWRPRFYWFSLKCV